jgi:glycerol dehydrogenase
MTDKPRELIDEVYSFCESVGLATTLAEIGLPKVTEEMLEKVAAMSMDKDNPIYNELVPISAQAIVSAIKAADHEGRLRKQESLS